MAACSNVADKGALGTMRGQDDMRKRPKQTKTAASLTDQQASPFFLDPKQNDML